MDFLSSQPRGLQKFIADIRSAKNKDDEMIRVDRELGNIRAKFSKSESLSSYDKKKYVWKLCYIYMLGYEVDFGFIEFISLISSTKYQEKSVGYMAFSLMLRPGDELLTLALSSLKNDLISNNMIAQNLALSAIANLGAGEHLIKEVLNLVIPPSVAITQIQFPPNASKEPNYLEMAYRSKVTVCKKAVVCFLRLFKINPNGVSSEEILAKVAPLLEDKEYGIITSTLSLVYTLASYNADVYSPFYPYVLKILARLTLSGGHPSDYLYYYIPSPWIQIKALRFLALYSLPIIDEELRRLEEILLSILNRRNESGQIENYNKSNTEHSILFEAISLIISYGVDCPINLKETVKSLLIRFISNNDPNIKYLSIDNLTKFIKQDNENFSKTVSTNTEANQDLINNIINALREGDISLGKKALNLLYVITNVNNSKFIVDSLVGSLSNSDQLIREDIVVKTVILAEKYKESTQWYLDIIFKLSTLAGEYISDAVWHRVYHIVIADQDIHTYAAEKAFTALESRQISNSTLCLCTCILGEIGVYISENEGRTGGEQLRLLYKHFTSAVPTTQALMLTCFVKLLNLYPEIKDTITDIFKKFSTSTFLEIQQRACEYLALSSLGNLINTDGQSSELLEFVLNAMPPHEVGDETVLLQTVEPANQEKSSSWNLVGQVTGAILNSNTGFTGGNPPNTSSTNVFTNSPPTKSTPPTATFDLLSLDDYTPTPSAPAVSSSIVSELELSNAKDIIKAHLYDQQKEYIALDNSTFKLKFKAEFKGHQGRVIGTVLASPSISLSNLSVNLKPIDGLLFKIALNPNNNTKEQSFAIMLDCAKPFHSNNPIDISFTTSTGQVSLSLPLPFSLSSFCHPISSDKDTFISRWQATPNGEIQEVFTSGTPLTPTYLQTLHSKILPGLNFSRVLALDESSAQNANDITYHTAFSGSSSLVTSAHGDNGQNLSFGILIRLEADVNSNKFRLTIRASHPLVVQNIKEVFFTILA